MLRYPALRRLTKNAGMLLVGSVLRMLFTVVFVVYAARFLGVEGYGKFALTQNLVELSLSLSATALGILVTRETAKHPEWLSRNLAPALGLVVALSLVAASGLVIFAHLANYAADTRLAIFVATFALVPGAAGMLAEALLVALDDAEYVGVGTAAESFLRIALGFTVLYLGYGLVPLFVVYIVTRTAQLLFYAALLMRRLPAIRWRVSFRTLRSLVRDWRTFALENWLATLYQSLDVVFLSVFHGEAAVGIYEAAHKLIRLGAVAARCFTTAAFPLIARLYVHARDTFHQVNIQSTKFILAAMLPVAVGITLAAPHIVTFVFDREYADSIAVLQILAWLLIPQFLNPFLSHVLFARGEQGRSLVVAVVALAAFLAAASLLIPGRGAVGAAWASLIAATTALGGYLAFVAAGKNGRTVLAMLSRQAVAAGILCGFILLVKGSGVILTLVAGGALYAASLILLRIVQSADFKLLQELR
jgi:O-antigen/teichoic acid export membrane protein